MYRDEAKLSMSLFRSVTVSDPVPRPSVQVVQRSEPKYSEPF